MYEYYKSLLLKNNDPLFLDKYLKSPSLLRLKKVGYFCGMDYASKDVYNFGEYISRFDHSLDVALIAWKYSKDPKTALAGLFHDIATPCFSHAIDYMNKDYGNQESTEELTGYIIYHDTYLMDCLKKDGIKPDDIIDFKKYPIVDNNRPKLCADRVDGVILPGLFWTKMINQKDIYDIVSHLTVFNNDNVMELGFDDLEIARKVVNVSDGIDIYCHSNEDNYMMELLAKLTKYLIDNNYIKYMDLYYLNEEDMHKIFNSIQDLDFQKDYYLFKHIKKEDIPVVEMPFIKVRNLKPLVNGSRIS